MMNEGLMNVGNTKEENSEMGFTTVNTDVNLVEAFRERLSLNLITEYQRLYKNILRLPETTDEFSDSRIADLDEDYIDDFSGDLAVRIVNHQEVFEVRENIKESVLSYVSGEVSKVIPLKNKYLGDDDLEKNEVEVMNMNSKKVVTKIFSTHRTDIEPIVTIDNGSTNRSITIDYGKLFNRPELSENFSELFTYNIGQKAYLGIIDKIVNDTNYILNEYPEFGMKMFKIRTRVRRDGLKYDEQEFLADIIDIVNDTKLRSIIRSIIESTYTISLDNVSKKSSKKIIEDLQLTDKTNMIILELAILDRILIPIINQYCNDTDVLLELTNEESKNRFNSMTLIVFNYISRIISNEREVNIISKLFKIIEPRVKSTNYSDRVIWRFLENHVLDDEVCINKFINKIIRTIIPKIDKNKSSISFLDVVIRKMIECDFKYKYLYSFKTINISTTDGDDINELDRVALNHYHKHNEMENIINSASIQQFINVNKTKYNIRDEEVEFLKSHIKALNEFQINVIKIYYSKFFKINELSHSHAVYLLMILSRIMESNNMDLLSKIIVGKIDRNALPEKTSGRISSDIIRSKAYQRIRSEYQTVISKFDKDAYLLKLSSVFNFNFVYYDIDSLSEGYLKDIDKKDISSEIFELVTLSM